MLKVPWRKSLLSAIKAILKHKQELSIHEKKNAVYYFQISLSVPEIFKFLKYANSINAWFFFPKEFCQIQLAVNAYKIAPTDQFCGAGMAQSQSQVRGPGARGPKFDLPDLTSEFLSALCSLSRFNTRQTEHWWRGGSKMSAPSTSGLSVDTTTSCPH